MKQLKTSSSLLPNVSILVQPTPQPERPAPGATSPTFGAAVTVEDPDNPEGAKILVGSESGLAFQPNRFTTAAVGPFATFGGGGTFEDVVTVVDPKGKVTRQRKVPVDLFLEEALTEGGLFADVVVGLSRGLASLIGLQNTTISQALASSSGTTPEKVHLLLGLPVVDVPVIGPLIRDALIREADLQLLRGDIAGLADSASFVVAEDPDVFPIIPTKRQREVADRIRGNLEILRIQEQEEL